MCSARVRPPLAGWAATPGQHEVGGLECSTGGAVGTIFKLVCNDISLVWGLWGAAQCRRCLRLRSLAVRCRQTGDGLWLRYIPQRNGTHHQRPPPTAVVVALGGAMRAAQTDIHVRWIGAHFGVACDKQRPPTHTSGRNQRPDVLGRRGAQRHTPTHRPHCGGPRLGRWVGWAVVGYGRR